MSQLVPEKVATSTCAAVIPRKGCSTMKCNVAVGSEPGVDAAAFGSRMSVTCPTKTASARQNAAHTGVPCSAHVQALTRSPNTAIEKRETLKRSSRLTVMALRLSAQTPGVVQKFHSGLFEILRRRRSLISAQGSSAARTLGNINKGELNPERVHPEANPFSVGRKIRWLHPELSLRSNSGLELANAFGVLVNYSAVRRSQRRRPA